MRAVARENPRLSGVIDVTDFNATAAGQRIVDDRRLAALVQVLNNPDYRLGLDDVEPDILGRAYEYLLRKFAEGQGQSAGEFYTPREVGVADGPHPRSPAGHDRLRPLLRLGRPAHQVPPAAAGDQGEAGQRAAQAAAPTSRRCKLFGQEINASTFAMARMNAFIHDMEAEIALGDTMHRPAFTERDGRLRQFDLVTANPMWNQEFDARPTRTTRMSGSSTACPPSSSADWGWVQHMVASAEADSGRMAVVLDTGAVSRGSGNQGSNKERDIRKEFVEADLVEAVVLLPENLFYNTTAPGIVLVLNRKKRHPGEILLINASKLFAKGRPKNYLEEQHIEPDRRRLPRVEGREGCRPSSRKDEAVKNDYNLSPSRYVATGGRGGSPAAGRGGRALAGGRGGAGRGGSASLEAVLAKLGFEGWRRWAKSERCIDNFDEGPIPVAWSIAVLSECADVLIGIIKGRTLPRPIAG